VTALLRSELLKVRTTRGWWAYLAVILLFSAIAVAGEIGSNPDFRSDLDFQVGLVETATWIARLIALVLGITIVTTELRHGTITPTLLATPVRERVFAAKGIATGLLAVLFDVLSLAVIAAVGLTWLTLVDAEIHLGAELAERAGQAVLAAVLWGLMGVAIGALVQSQVAALVGTLIWIFLGETLLWGLFGWLDLDGAASYLPFQALDGADGTRGDDMLAYAPALVVSVAWIALIGAAGLWRLRRRDIT
jgi:ABC-type transport system involved in multi-copper enzyme maturation permease subunit